MTTVEVTQPWVTYTYGRTHDKFFPPWNSTRILGRACIVAHCFVCGTTTPLWMKIPRFKPIPDRGYHPVRVAYLQQHRHGRPTGPVDTTSHARTTLGELADELGIDMDSL